MRWSLVLPLSAAIVVRDTKPQETLKTASDRSIFVGYLSAPGNVQRRERVRQTCFPAYQAHGVHAKFFIGRPSLTPTNPKDHSQGLQATPAEIQMANEMMDESRKYHDIILIPFRETYRDLGDKIVALFKYGLEHTNASIILKVDDDTCANLNEVITSASSANRGREVYGGYADFAGSEYSSMAGPDRCIYRYMSGPVYFLTRKLAYAIFIDDHDHTILWAPYGTSSDDANIGKFIGHLKASHPTMVVQFVVNSRIMAKDMESKMLTRFSSKPKTEPLRNCSADDSKNHTQWYLTRFATETSQPKV